MRRASSIISNRSLSGYRLDLARPTHSTATSSNAGSLYGYRSPTPLRSASKTRDYGFPTYSTAVARNERHRPRLVERRSSEVIRNTVDLDFVKRKINELEKSILAHEEKLERERLELDQQYQKLDRAIQKCSEDDAAKRAKTIRQEEERRYGESSNFSYSRW